MPGQHRAGSPAANVALGNVFRRFWPFARRNRLLLALSITFLLVATACETAGIMLFGVITDRVLQTGDFNAFWVPGIGWLVAACIGGFAMFGGNYLCSIASERFLLLLRDHVFGHLQRLSPSFFEERPIGDLLSRLTADTEEIESLVASGIVHLISAFASMVVFAGAALYLRWDLALVAFAVAPVLWLAVRGFSRRVGEAAARERRSSGTIGAIAEESLSNVALVQAYNRETTEHERFHAEGRTWKLARLAESRLSALYDGMVEIVETLCVLAVLGFGAWEVAHHRLTLGGLLSFAGFIGYLYPPVQSLGQLTLNLVSARASAARVMELLDTAPAVSSRTDRRPADKARGHIEFRSVEFRYPGSTRTSLSDLSLTASPGEVVTIAGPSGAGKSTISKLLLRYYDPDRGGIFLDGVDIRTLPLEYVRESVTLLLQETLVFDGTIYENIAFGSPHATRSEVMAAARAAEVDTFVRTMPDAYETVIGQRGRRLSGGQRQRIAIARAIVRNSPVLILDEPTAGLDAATAQRIMRPLRRLMAGRTTILITHDLDLVPAPDATVMIDGGRRAQTLGALA